MQVPASWRHRPTAIADLETKFESYNGAYWVTSRTWVYATAGQRHAHLG
jgi:hypothetical protein